MTLSPVVAVVVILTCRRPLLQVSHSLFDISYSGFSPQYLQQAQINFLRNFVLKTQPSKRRFYMNCTLHAPR